MFDKDQASSPTPPSDNDSEETKQTATDDGATNTELSELLKSFSGDTQAEIERLKAEVAQLTDSLARSQAEFQNFRKRQLLELEQNLKYASSQLITDLLPVLDNFQRGFQHTPEHLKQEQWVIGMLAIEKQFQQLLEKIGVRKITTVGERADPHVHEVLSAGDQPNTAPDTIIEEYEAGYMLHDKVLRPAKVKVQQ
ncbi:nucleotide exchange factor GrpE [Candidatus Gracilibacteria bacterium]|nr:nucleotide exchange factor GrpE [Candidatus Gracilibacteria bacterium]